MSITLSTDEAIMVARIMKLAYDGFTPCLTSDEIAFIDKFVLSAYSKDSDDDKKEF